MRDLERIERMIAMLRRIWKANPDMRLGQLIENLLFSGSDRHWLWNVEDDLTERKFRAAMIGGLSEALETT